MERLLAAISPAPPRAGISRVREQAMTDAAVPRSLVWATDADVLSLDRVVERRDG